MGFSNIQARAALRCCDTVEQATEYILNNLSEIETTEEDQIRRAIEASMSDVAASSSIANPVS